MQEFHAWLSALYRAAGEPTYERLARRTKVAASTLHEWLTGKAVPGNERKLAT
ncbi:hypothetical protein JK356_13200, partial [Streptomyces sp. 7-21]|nr:hypothetical protein [Streptomyces sp. 7-21]